MYQVVEVEQQRQDKFIFKIFLLLLVVLVMIAGAWISLAAAFYI